MTRIAIWGTGSIGMRHLRIFSTLQGVDIFAIPTRPERVSELRAAGFQAESQLDYLPDLDGVVVATNTRRHLSDAKAALQLGAHVLIEKPLAPSKAGVRDLLDFAIAQKVGVFVGCCLRFDSSLTTFRQKLPEIKPVYTVEISCRSYLPEWRPGNNYQTGYAASLQEGGVLRDLIHEIDYALWLYGEPTRVFGRLANSGQLGIPTEDQAILLWKSNQGVQVCIQLDYLARTPVRYMTAYGENGQISVDLINRKVTYQKPGDPPDIVSLNAARDDMYLGQAQAFLQAINGEETGNLASGIDGLRSLAICDAARQCSLICGAEELVEW